MRKLWLILVLAALIITACTPKTPAPTPTAVPPTAAPTTATSTDPTTVQSEDCQVTSIFPEPKAPLNVTVPRPSADDWTIGPANARMVVIEYSDFQ